MNIIWFLKAFALVTVSFPRVESFDEQFFAIEPENMTAISGSKIVLPCRISQKSGIVQWTMNGFGLGDKRHLPGYDRYAMIGKDEDGDYSLEIYPVSLEDEGEYQCQVSAGPQGQNPLRSKFAWLSVIKPSEPPAIHQKNQMSEERSTVSLKSTLMVRPVEISDLSTYNCSVICSDRADSMERRFKMRRNYFLYIIILGGILTFLTVAIIIFNVILSRRSPNKGMYKKSIKFGDRKISGHRLKLVDEADDICDMDSAKYFGNEKKGFFNDIEVNLPQSASLESFRLKSQKSPGIYEHSADLSGSFSKDIFPTKMEVNKDYVSYVGYSGDYGPPAVRSCEVFKDGHNLLAPNSFTVPFKTDSDYSKVCGIDQINKEYLKALDSLIPENLLPTLGNPPRLPCATVWQNSDINLSCKNRLDPVNESDESILDKVTLF